MESVLSSSDITVDISSSQASKASSNADLSLSLRNLYQVNLDVQETKSEIIVLVDLPGVEVNSLRVTVSRANELKIEGERTSNSLSSAYMLVSERVVGLFSRSFELPCLVSGKLTTAAMHNGVLQIVLAKANNA
ncbi:hypothetical protein HK100_006169 [Physocladia obscura]|uniref:SHSP domain-containing protein n=1 Tax=Physocladia obscura TaxID=109957 RepID=A0AAD5T5Z7_9FUNG|nr:hypothetical protein HK100_006169 [Physocladia obscura]